MNYVPLPRAVVPISCNPKIALQQFFALLAQSIIKIGQRTLESIMLLLTERAENCILYGTGAVVDQHDESRVIGRRSIELSAAMN